MSKGAKCTQCKGPVPFHKLDCGHRAHRAALDRTTTTHWLGLGAAVATLLVERQRIDVLTKLNDDFAFSEVVWRTVIAWCLQPNAAAANDPAAAASAVIKLFDERNAPKADA